MASNIWLLSGQNYELNLLLSLKSLPCALPLKQSMDR